MNLAVCPALHLSKIACNLAWLSKGLLNSLATAWCSSKSARQFAISIALTSSEVPSVPSSTLPPTTMGYWQTIALGISKRFRIPGISKPFWTHQSQRRTVLTPPPPLKKRGKGFGFWTLKVKPSWGCHRFYAHSLAPTLPTRRPILWGTCVQKRNLKRPAASAFLNLAISPRQLRLACRKFESFPRRRLCDRCGGPLNPGKSEAKLNMNSYRRKNENARHEYCESVVILSSRLPKMSFLSPVPHFQGIPQWDIRKCSTPSIQHCTFHDWAVHQQDPIAHRLMGSCPSKHHQFQGRQQPRWSRSWWVHLGTLPIRHERASCSWIGYAELATMVRRGHADTLILEQLPIRNTWQKAPGPGPINSDEWAPVKKRSLLREQQSRVPHC